jgi:hypothetical protein
VKEWTALQGGAYMVAAKLAFFFIKKMKRAVKKSQRNKAKPREKKDKNNFFRLALPRRPMKRVR